MNVLIVYAHPEPQSFNGAMKDLAVEVLTGAGHTVEVSDLYAMKFDAAGGPADVLEREDPSVFRYQREQSQAHEKHLFTPQLQSKSISLRRSFSRKWTSSCGQISSCFSSRCGGFLSLRS